MLNEITSVDLSLCFHKNENYEKYYVNMSL